MRKNIAKNWPKILLALYLVEFVILAINPAFRQIWLTENLIALITVTVLIVMYFRGNRFSNTAYTLMALWVGLHTIGGHYTFEQVPIDRVTEFFGFSRNHFDRVCHFLVGVFAYPAMELIEKHKLIKGRFFAAFAVIMGVFGFAGIFEIVEWLYAVIANPEAGAAFLGSQGDIWDAQKDMLADGLGALSAVILYVFLNPQKRDNPQNPSCKL